MFSLTRKVSASAGDDWLTLLMGNELRVQIKFPLPYLGLRRRPMESGLNAAQQSLPNTTGRLRLSQWPSDFECAT